MQTTLTFLDLALAAIAGIIGGLVVERVTHKVKAIPLGVLAGALIGVLVAQAVVQAGATTSSQPPATAESPPAHVTDSSTSEVAHSNPSIMSSPTASPLIVATDTGQSVTTDATTSAPEGTESGPNVIRISATSDQTAEASSTGPGLDLRFWHYPGTLGDVEIHGDFALADETITGTDCGNPYVSYFAGGVAPGTYLIRVYIPDIDNLSRSVDYGFAVLDQDIHRGQWVEIGQQDADTTPAGGHTLGLSVKQQYEPAAGTGCVPTGRHIAFGAVEFVGPR